MSKVDKVKRGNIIALGALGLIVIAAASWFFIISPRLDAYNDAKAQTVAAQDRQVQIQTQIGRLQQQCDELPTVTGEVTSFHDAFPAPGSQTQQQLVAAIYAAGDASGVAVTSVTPAESASTSADGTAPAAAGANDARPVSLTIAGTGSSLSSAGAFVSALESMNPALIVNTVTADGGEAGTINVTGTTFLVPGIDIAAAEAICAQQN